MTENERQLREWIRAVGGGPGSIALRDLEVALAHARAEALEEVFRPLDRAFQDMETGTHGWGIVRDTLDFIRLRKDTATPAAVPVEKVREEAVRILSGGSDDYERGIERGVRMLCGALGVVFDGVTCPACGERGQHKMSCRATERNAAGQRHHADRGAVAVITGATRGSCVSYGRDTINGICSGCREIGGECVCPVAS